MSNKVQMENLIDFLAKQLLCEYLSDLRSDLSKRHQLRVMLEEIESGLYSLRAWQEATCYLLRCTDLPQSEEEARKWLNSGLK